MSAPSIDDTMTLSAMAHSGQADRAGKPYADHPRRVMAHLIIRWPYASADELRAALLHDVIEDTAVTTDQLRAAGYSDGVLAILDLLTRRDGETYANFIERIATSENTGAIRVKLSDLADNLAPARLALLPPADRGLVPRYEAARRRLDAQVPPAPDDRYYPF